MFKRYCCLAIIGVLLLPSLHVSAQRKPGKYIVYGPGTKSCGKWLADNTDSNAHFINTAWVLGFISGIGYLGWEMKETDSAAINAWIDNYCRSNPLTNIADASAALARELKQQPDR